MSAQLALLPEYLTAHVQLTLLALLCSAALSLPLGVAVTRVRWLEQPVLGLAAAASGGFLFYMTRRVGGYTGDGLGAMAQLGEIVVLVVLAGLWLW